MSKHSIQLKTFFMLLGVAMSLSACNHTAIERSDPVSEATPAQLETRPVEKPNPAPVSSATPAVSQSPASQRSQSLNAPKLATKTSTETKQTRREDYKLIPLSEIGEGGVLVGKDPKAIALETFRNNEPETGAVEATVDYPQPNLAVVIITQIGLPDDSVRGIRYRTEFVPNTESASTGKQWKLVWAGSQVICQPGRGHQDWSTKLCL